MKKIMLIAAIVLWITSPALAGEPQDLSPQAMENVQQQTREMSSLGIPEDQAQKMLTQMVRNRFQQQNITRAQQVVMEAAKAGLPTEPVMSKAMEGMAKQAREQQIIAAMEAVRSRHAYGYRVAKTLSYEKKSMHNMARTIADSLAAGMTVQDIDKVMAQLQARNRQQIQDHEEKLSLQTMQTVRTMARMGVSSTNVSDTLCQAVQNRYSWQEMKTLRHQITKQAHLSSPRQIARQHAGSIGKGNKGSSSGSGSGNGPGAGQSGGNGEGGSGSGGDGGNGGGSGGGGGGGGGNGGGGGAR